MAGSQQLDGTYAKYQRRYQETHKVACALKAQRHYDRYADKIRRRCLLRALNSDGRQPRPSTVARYNLIYDPSQAKWT